MLLNDTDPPGGALWVTPGAPRPHNLRSTRPDWVGRVTRGRLASALPETLGRLFGLCSRAHVSCAGLAVQAALQGSDEVAATLREQVAAQTARDHVQQIWLDWPRQLAPAAGAEALHASAGPALVACPAFAPAPVPGALASWLQTHALGMPAVDWLAGWERDPQAWLQAWSEQTPGDLALQLRDCRRAASAALPAVPALRVHDEAESLRALAHRLNEDAGVARQPQWRGACAETGPWTRLNGHSAQALDTPWLRLGARLAETVRLALPDEPGRCGAAWLVLGALPLGAGEGIAWVEMARGLLIHHVCLEGRGAAARVATCQVVAPTEWNFHPDGAVARVVEQLPAAPTAEATCRLATLVAAYSPCVPVRQAPQTIPDEVAHA